MSELVERIARANPLTEADHTEDGLIPSIEVVRAEAEQARLNRGRRDKASRRELITPARRRAGAAVATAVAVSAVAVALLSSGARPSVAQAFPILAQPGTDISTATGWQTLLGLWLSPQAIEQATQSAHEVPITDGRAYVLSTPYALSTPGQPAPDQPTTPDQSTLCIVATSNTGPAAGSGWIANCGAKTVVEQHAMIYSFGFAPGDEDFVALVPTGGSLTLADDGTTTSVPITDGVATGVIHDAATLTATIGNTTSVRQLSGPSGPGAAGPTHTRRQLGGLSGLVGRTL